MVRDKAIAFLADGTNRYLLIERSVSTDDDNITLEMFGLGRSRRRNPTVSATHLI